MLPWRTAGAGAARGPRSSTSAASRRGPGPSRCPPTRSSAGASGAGGAGGRANRGRRSRSTPQRRQVARAALDAGATLVNDVTAFRADPQMAALVADRDAECCLMHMLGEPRTMQRDPRYEDVVDEVKAFLAERLEFAVGEGISERADHARPRDRLRQDARPQPRAAAAPATSSWPSGGRSSIGTSRKASWGRRACTRGCRRRSPRNVLALERGASVFRVHDVAPMRDALVAAAATLGDHG